LSLPSRSEGVLALRQSCKAACSLVDECEAYWGTAISQLSPCARLHAAHCPALRWHYLRGLCKQVSVWWSAFAGEVAWMAVGPAPLCHSVPPHSRRMQLRCTPRAVQHTWLPAVDMRLPCTGLPVGVSRGLPSGSVAACCAASGPHLTWLDAAGRVHSSSAAHKGHTGAVTAILPIHAPCAGGSGGLQQQLLAGPLQPPTPPSSCGSARLLAVLKTQALLLAAYCGQ
jgi:hypothetical protein